MITVIVRMILTLLLCYGVYTETGKWTALSILLIIIVLELNQWVLSGVIEEETKRALGRFFDGETHGF